GEICAFGRERKPICGRFVTERRLRDGTPIDRAFFGERMRGNFRGDLPMIQNFCDTAVGNRADNDRVQSPLFENVEHFALAAFFRDEEHTLLRFAEHDFVRRHAGFALGHFGEIDFDAGAAARGHFHRRAGEAGGAHVLNGDDYAGLHGFEAGFEQELLHEGVADLHVWALLLGFFGELRRGEQRCAVNTIAACFCTDVDDGIADALRFREENFFFARDAESEGVNQRILRIARLESDFAADGWDAETISVICDAANHSVEDAPVLGSLFFARTLARSDFAEAERIKNRDRPRAHGKNIAEDAADARCRALERLDVAWMIVRLDFERGDEAIADVYDPRVFARTLHDEFAACRQAFQVHFARFVGAVLAPHHTENAELGDVGIAAQDLLNARVFVTCDAVFGGNFRSHFDFGACGSHLYGSRSFSRFSVRDSDQNRQATRWRVCRLPRRS